MHAYMHISPSTLLKSFDFLPISYIDVCMCVDLCVCVCVCYYLFTLHTVLSPEVIGLKHISFPSLNTPPSTSSFFHHVLCLRSALNKATIANT